MLRRCMFGLVLGAFACPAEAYYVAWEGDCLPEEAGWSRSYGDWIGIPHGTGAIRTIQDGVMTMDSLYDSGVFDLAYWYRSFNPAPGEMLVMEWRLVVEQVVGIWDPGVVLYTDDCWTAAFKWSQDTVFLTYSGQQVHVAPGQFHDYRVTSSDMRTFSFFVDGDMACEGSFSYGGGTSTLCWGDGTQGAASLHRWDYVRIYTIPEPTCLALCGAVLLFLARRRRIS